MKEIINRLGSIAIITVSICFFTFLAHKNHQEFSMDKAKEARRMLEQQQDITLEEFALCVDKAFQNEDTKESVRRCKNLYDL